MRQDLLCASFLFPRTESLSRDKPAISIEVETLNFNHLQQRIGSAPEAIVLGMCEDLSLILGLIKEAAGELCLDKFDCIQLCCSGQAMLHIQLKGNKCGQSALRLDMNSYCQYLVAILQPRARDWVFALLLIVATTILVVDALVVHHRGS